VRSLVLDDQTLLRALASGRQKGRTPRWRRVEMRYVDLKAGRHLQLTAYDDTQAHTSNHAVGDPARRALDAVLDEPFGSWHVDTTKETVQVRVTKKLDAMVHAQRVDPAEADGAGESARREHDRRKPRLLAEDDPVLVALGISDAEGRVKPSRQAKYRQVEEFLRALATAIDDVDLPADRPLRVVDLGCGNAYLTFAAHRFLTQVRGLDVLTTGVDVKAQSLAHNTDVARRLGISDTIEFVQAPISSSALEVPPDVVLALHACDTATDDALAAAVEWGALLVLAAPCCHHDIAAQLRRVPAPTPYALLTRHGILRERFADTLTDALRAAVLRQLGYRVDVVEFVESRHTPRNTLVRARRTSGNPLPQARQELDELVAAWQVHPKLAELLHDRLAPDPGG
jgi:SAM-dependent methyltransferase